MSACSCMPSAHQLPVRCLRHTGCLAGQWLQAMLMLRGSSCALQLRPHRHRAHCGTPQPPAALHSVPCITRSMTPQSPETLGPKIKGSAGSLSGLTLQARQLSGQDADRVRGYFGMREVSLGLVGPGGHPRPLINGEFVFQIGMLDQVSMGWQELLHAGWCRAAGAACVSTCAQAQDPMVWAVGSGWC